MKRFIFTLVTVGVISAGLGVWLTADPDKKGTWGDVGKALMTLSVTVWVGGAVAAWLKLNERNHEVKEQWAELLQDVVEAHQKLTVACQLINAHKTAKTYAEQHEKILSVRSTLRRFCSHPLVAGDRAGRGKVSLLGHLQVMKDYVERLGDEYARQYLAAARQQRIDEQCLKVHIEELVGQGIANPRMEVDLNDWVYKPTRSWDMLTNTQSFRRLNDFITNFDNSCFEASFKDLRGMLETRAGINKVSTSPQSAPQPVPEGRDAAPRG
jgi:hypothetical protein